jgi:predicted metal-binding protein
MCLYSVEHNSVFIALVATTTRFGRYNHRQASAIQNLKKAGYMQCIKMSSCMGVYLQQCQYLLTA